MESQLHTVVASEYAEAFITKRGTGEKKFSSRKEKCTIFSI
jgi:hypothetical protein